MNKNITVSKAQEITLNKDTVGSVTSVLDLARSGGFSTMTIKEIVETVNNSNHSHDAFVKNINKSKRYILGKGLQVAISKSNSVSNESNLKHFSKKDIFKMFDVKSNSAYRAMALVERIDGLEAILSLPDMSNDDTRVLQQYRDAMGSHPDVSTVFGEVVFTFSEPVADEQDVPLYTFLDEAYVFDDSLTYYNKPKIPNKDFKSYVERLVLIAEEARVYPWEISRDMVEDEDERLKQEEVDEATEDDEEAQTEAKTTSTDKVETKAKPASSRTTTLASKRIVIVNARREGFDFWFAVNKLGYEPKPFSLHKEITGASFDILDHSKTWDSKRKSIMRMFHSDTGGDDETMAMINSIDKLFKVTHLSEKNLANTRLREGATDRMEEMSEDDLVAIYEEFTRSRDES